MKRNRRWIVLMLALAVIGSWGISFGVGRLQAQAQAPFAPTGVAVVNISELITNSGERTAFNEKMRIRDQEFQTEGQRRQQAIEVMQRDLDILPAGSPERLKKEEEILGQVANLQAWQQLQQQLAMRESRLALIQLYTKINDTTALIAQQRGIEVVLLDTPVPPLNQMTPDQITATINGRSVMYRAERVDITADVLAQLNADWANRANNP